jgi:predicted MFS family arabinose efflux permease
LRGADFRRLLGIRFLGQGGDGFFQSALVSSIVFNPAEGSTTVGLLKAALITALPFTLLGPFVGVFIDRWPRRAILTRAPLLKVAFLPLVLADPATVALPFYLGALAVLSVNRFHLATAGAVVPRVVATDDLLAANSLATVGGTLFLLLGAFFGGKLADATGSSTAVVVVAGVAWLLTSLVASRMSSDLAPLSLPPSAELLRHAIRRVVVEMADGARTLARTPRALGPITTITVDQVGQGIILTLALVVFRDELGEGVGSFSNVIGAGGAGVLLGILTVGGLAARISKPRLIGIAFLVGGAVLIAAGLIYEGWAILTASFVVGLAFAWKKIPTDTIVQESLPDGYRGRVFSVYDVAYNLARIVAAIVAVPLVPAVGTDLSVILVGLVFLAWAPVLPVWLRGVPEVRVTRDGGGAPVAVAWGAVTEPVVAFEEPEPGRLRVALEDGSTLDLESAEGTDGYSIARERDIPKRPEA